EQQRCVAAVITAGSSRAGRVRTMGRPGSSQGRMTARDPVRSTPGGVRDRRHAEGARTRGSYMSVLDQACLWARAAAAARSAWRWPFRHRLAAEAAAFIQPTLGVRIVACRVAARDEINRGCPVASVLEQRGGGTIANMLCGSGRVVVGTEASRPREGCTVAGDAPPVV